MTSGISLRAVAQFLKSNNRFRASLQNPGALCHLLYIPQERAINRRSA
jgi:hypothetical protein